MKRVLVDTSAYVQLMRNNQQVKDQLEAAHQVFFSVVVIGELLYGFKKGSREDSNLKLLFQFLHQPTVQLAPIDQEAAEVYAALYLQLEKKGILIPINDVWIAAQSIALGAQLITFDQHFERIAGLRLSLCQV